MVLLLSFTIYSVVLKLIEKISNTKCTFMYLKLSHSTLVLNRCNLQMKTRRQDSKLSLENAFLKKCILSYVMI